VAQSADALAAIVKPLMAGGRTAAARKPSKVGPRCEGAGAGPGRAAGTTRPQRARRGRPPATRGATRGLPTPPLAPLPFAAQGFGAKPAGGPAPGGGTRFAVELPVADTSAAATAALAGGVLARLPPGPWRVVFADEAAARASAGAGPARGVHLREACRGAALDGPLLIVAPCVADVSGRLARSGPG
jgi:hypothetical protein